MSDTSGSGSDSGSYESSSSSGSEDEVLLKPVFLKKTTKLRATQPSALEIALLRAEHHLQLHEKAAEKTDYDGVDDTDDIDPEAEFEQWKQRERSRYERDIQRLRDEEQEKEDAIRRKQTTSAEQPEPSAERESGSADGAKIGAFYSSQVDEKFLKRDYHDIEDSGDHSRPTKYRGKR